jgi:P4 family phage/plasmid primase-like protien
MTLEIKSYTDSAISDLFRSHFNRFKENNAYKYVILIDLQIIQSRIIEIDYNDFNDEIKTMLEREPKERIHTALYRAIGEVFQIRHGYTELDNRKQENAIQFQLVNSNLFESKVCSNPNLIHYDNYVEEDYQDEDKIDKVANVLQKRNKFVTLRNTEEILLYNGKIYDNLQAETLIKEETEKLIPNCSKHHRSEVISKIKAQTYMDIEKFDTDSNLITLENGILNLETLELLPHTPEHLSRVLLPVEYRKPTHEDIEKNLKDTLFWKFLKNSFTVNDKFRKNDFETVLEIIASPIVKRHVDEKAFMFLGGGENGKSVCLGYIESIMGKNNVSSITLQDISDDKFMRANLAGKSANIFSDLEQNELRHTGKIKAITSNEGIEVQKKHQQGFTLYPFCKLMFSCNRFPKVFDQTQGFFRRWIIVKWERDFENDPERVEYLKEKLADNLGEKTLVFSCLVGIADRLNKEGKFTHSKDWKTIQKEWNENADPIDDFDSNYIIDSENHKSKRETYHFYKEIMLGKGETPKGMGQFSKAFAEYRDEYIVKDNGKTERVWLNIDFKRPIQTTLKEIDTN